jgi:hypothetical protein
VYFLSQREGGYDLFISLFVATTKEESTAKSLSTGKEKEAIFHHSKVTVRNIVATTTEESTAKSLSTEKEKNALFHHSKATVRKNTVYIVIQSTTTKAVYQQTVKDSFPYLIGIFVLILVLTLTYIGQCFYKRFFKTNNINNTSLPEIPEVPANDTELNMRTPNDVLEEATYSDVRQVNMQTRGYNPAAESTQHYHAYEVIENQKSHEECLLQDINVEENVMRISSDMKTKERQNQSPEKPENMYLTVLA